jgi:hypothetical protein
LLIITDTMSRGKISVLGEASDLHSMSRMRHAPIDGDALGLAHLLSEACNDAVMYANPPICLRKLCCQPSRLDFELIHCRGCAQSLFKGKGSDTLAVYAGIT